MDRIGDSVAEGEKLSTAVIRGFRLPPADSWFLSSLEGSPHLPAALEEVARRCLGRAERRTLFATQVVIPLIVLVQGLIVLLMALAIFIPQVQVLHAFL